MGAPGNLSYMTAVGTHWSFTVQLEMQAAMLKLPPCRSDSPSMPPSCRADKGAPKAL